MGTYSHVASSALLLEGRHVAAADLREAGVELGQFVGVLVDDLQHPIDVVRRHLETNVEAPIERQRLHRIAVHVAPEGRRFHRR